MKQDKVYLDITVFKNNKKTRYARVWPLDYLNNSAEEIIKPISRFLKNYFKIKNDRT